MNAPLVKPASLLKPADPTDKVLHINDPRAPQFRFEWHPKKQNVYMIRLARKPQIGEVIAFNIENHGAAHNAVMIFMRGYNERRLEETLPDYNTAELIERVPHQVREQGRS